MTGGGSETGGNWYDNGGQLPAGLVVEKNTTGKPIPVWTVEQLERAAAWIKAHYSTGSFECPDSPANPDA